MTTIFRSPNFLLTSEIRAHLARRFILALKRYEKRISLVEIYIEDLAESGHEERGIEVVVEVSLHGMQPVVATMVSYEPYSAISIAAKRTRRAVKRAIRHYDTVDHYGLRALAGYGPRSPVPESG